MNWHSSGIHHRLEYWRVDPVTLVNKTKLDNIRDGGHLKRDFETALKVSGSVPFVGELTLGNDYLRIYTVSSIGEDVETIEQGTFIVSTPTTDINGGLITGQATLYSLLQRLKEQTLIGVLTLPEGTNVIAKATEIVRSVGLSVIADASSYTLNVAAVFDDQAGGSSSDNTLLGVVNQLLRYAGFEDLDIDGHGNAIMRQYTDAGKRAPTVVFADDDQSILSSEAVRREYDIFSVPNQVIVVNSNSDGCLTATATNDNPASPYSTVTRGRVIQYKETVNDIASQTAAQALASRILAEKSSVAESISFQHAYLPYRIGDTIALNYQSGGLMRELVSISDSVRLDYTLESETIGRRYI